MAIVHFVTHPEVIVDPAVPVPEWRLSEAGVQRAAALARSQRVKRVRTVFSSGERKAREVADMLATALSGAPLVLEDLGENDRSATGYLPPTEFELVADAFFSHPEESIRGWERAVDSQQRIVAAVDRAIAMADAANDIAISSHGGVGALLLCHLKGMPISRSEDQPGRGGGNVFSFDAATRRVIRGWRSYEEF